MAAKMTTMLTAETTASTQALWRVRLASALRTAVAGIIVGCTTLYGPEHLRRIQAFPAFSYVTTILIVSDATLGDTLRGCFNAIYAILQIMIPAVLSLWLVEPGRFTPGLAAVVVTLTSFLVALPESTPLMTKRLAFGQIVIVCVGAVIHGAETGVVMHPTHVASSTALGAFASVLAMLIPYPLLAYYEVKKTCRLYTENASERLNLFVKAFTAQDKTTAVDLITEAKFLFKAGSKLLLSIKDKQKGMPWERPQMRFLKPKCIDPREKLQELEVPIRGMELALTSCPSFPVGMIDEELRDVLHSLKADIGLKLEQVKCYASFDATTAPEIKKECVHKSLRALKNISSTEDVPASFFFYCMELLRDGLPVAPSSDCVVKETEKTNTEQSSDSRNQNRSKCKLKQSRSTLSMLPSRESLLFALKCSLSLGLAVLLGLAYNRENGYWSGLAIAISFERKRQATFTVTNARAQGTAMGSVYGIICCIMFQKFENFRFLALLPWIVFTTFLRHSRMYGDPGRISAVIGALLILGRKNYGKPSEFAIARITEATIGLMCFVIVEILFQPARAATLAKTQLAQSLEALRDAIEDIVLFVHQKNIPTSTVLRDKQKKLTSHINELEKFTAEAKLEPNFWFLPFNDTCYEKLLGSLSRMADLLLFVAYKTEFLSEISEGFGVEWKDFKEQITDDLELFTEKVTYSLKCLEEVVLIKSLTVLEQELQNRNISHDIELGRSSNEDVHRSLSPDEEEVEEILSSFLQHSNEVVHKIHTNEGEDKLKCEMVLSFNVLAFCISRLMRETTEIEKEIKKLLKWENPTRNINLYEISCKLNALYTK
ncbi:p-hydroxybenzoic acid efflux pump subunit aaeB [Melia azedarach]|uniref:p-hydroxybenzoic acid efflux pump subunit aaeB n=1 Tax=Melia azedarach TaxID=155640 RepID=A0ACC1X132_MELAZ|nr:p-hydroxybenzoic acid efflux pump subunit aaeB [Melia azedarach]